MRIISKKVGEESIFIINLRNLPLKRKHAAGVKLKSVKPAAAALDTGIGYVKIAHPPHEPGLFGYPDSCSSAG